MVEDADAEVFITHRGLGPGGLAGTVHVVPEHPFDVVGWDGCLYPYAFSVRGFEPITGRVHQPPPVPSPVVAQSPGPGRARGVRRADLAEIGPREHSTG